MERHPGLEDVIAGLEAEFDERYRRDHTQPSRCPRCGDHITPGIHHRAVEGKGCVRTVKP